MRLQNGRKESAGTLCILQGAGLELLHLHLKRQYRNKLLSIMPHRNKHWSVWYYFLHDVFTHPSVFWVILCQCNSATHWPGIFTTDFHGKTNKSVVIGDRLLSLSFWIFTRLFSVCLIHLRFGLNLPGSCWRRLIRITRLRRRICDCCSFDSCVAEQLAML